MQTSPSPHNHGCAANDPGDHRRFGEIAEIERARPGPVLRLIEHEIGGGGLNRREPHGEEDAKAKRQAQEIVLVPNVRARGL